MTIPDWQNKIHKNNVEKGFWDDRKNKGEVLMLVVSELAEALEADREDNYCKLGRTGMLDIEYNDGDDFKYEFEKHVKNTFEDEIADAVIRLIDLATGFGINLEWHMQQKMRYNELRPKMHGKKY